MTNRTLLLLTATLTLAACNSGPTMIPPSSQSRSSISTSSSLSTSVASSSSSSSIVNHEGKDVLIESPVVNSLVKSPLIVKGKARGTWFFEAQLAVQLTDTNGNIIATAPGKAKGEWMTSEYVDFEATMTFTTDKKSGYIVIKKDNPSGLPSNDAQVRIPVTF